MRSTIAVALALCSAGCDAGGGAGGGSCGSFDACGGDLVGTWTVKDVCYDPTGLQSDEPACSNLLRSVETHASGSMTFSADGMISGDLTLSVDVHVVWTNACIGALSGNSAVNVASRCSALEDTYLARGTFERAACRVVGADCACALTSVPMMDTSSGLFMYSADGTAIVEPDGGVENSFCVDGDSLTVAFASTDGSISGVVSLTRAN